MGEYFDDGYLRLIGFQDIRSSDGKVSGLAIWSPATDVVRRSVSVVREHGGLVWRVGRFPGNREDIGTCQVVESPSSKRAVRALLSGYGIEVKREN